MLLCSSWNTRGLVLFLVAPMCQVFDSYFSVGLGAALATLSNNKRDQTALEAGYGFRYLRWIGMSSMNPLRMIPCPHGLSLPTKSQYSSAEVGPRGTS